MEGGPMMKVDGCGAGMNVEFFNPGSSCATEYSVFPSMHVRETAFGSSSCSSYDAANAPEDWGMAGKFYKVESVSGPGPKVSFPCTDSSCGTCDMDVAMASTFPAASSSISSPPSSMRSVPVPTDSSSTR